ncbi:hypothetical protein AOXY_G27492 [Acipenser oxyrinchus oxyrinchus]|uniref:Uncharacterized protein n=1 Tax=Acipenser oxyrinchus oxyrinchus TaxID=40147 RepID=A0AAD8FX67_ACIOX|nr:hypothetical protein AOXY_G27492 [Acipenser oxyrinchus oxyrinchus]
MLNHSSNQTQNRKTQTDRGSFVGHGSVLEGVRIQEEIPDLEPDPDGEEGSEPGPFRVAEGLHSVAGTGSEPGSDRSQEKRAEPAWEISAEEDLCVKEEPSGEEASSKDVDYSAREQGGYSAREQGGYSAGEQGGYSAGEQGGYSAGEQGGYSAGEQGGYSAGEQGGYSAGEHGGYNAGEQGGEEEEGGEGKG